MKKSNILETLLLGTVSIFSGCGSNGTSATTADTFTYSVSVTNLTAGQPMSPVLITSSSIYHAGESASVGLETLAAGGDNSELLSTDSVSGSGLLTPSSSETLTIDTQKQTLSIATMLVKTNDAFAGIESYDVASLKVAQSTTLFLNVYDVGTENNDETNTTVPGLGGEGYNAERETVNIVTLHSGIISKNDGLVRSNLSSLEKFNNPALKVVITRTK